MNSKHNPDSIKSLLDITTTQLSAHTLDKLRTARTHALAHQRNHGTAPILALLSGRHDHSHHSAHVNKSLNWAVAALFVACLISGASLWHDYTSEHEISEVDVAILTDDLPIHVYLD